MEDEIVKSGIKFAIAKLEEIYGIAGARDATMPLAKALDEIGRLETKHA
jgi:hypothetical protein